MYGCESWTIKKAERRRFIWCLWTVMLKILESPLDCKEIQPVHAKGNQSCIFIGRTDAEAETLNTLATWYEEPTHWKRLWIWERLKVGGEGNERGWDCLMASLTRRTWVWVSSGSWWWTGKPGVLQSMGSQRVGHEWVIELNWIFPLSSRFLCLVQEGLYPSMVMKYSPIVLIICSYFVYLS